MRAQQHRAREARGSPVEVCRYQSCAAADKTPAARVAMNVGGLDRARWRRVSFIRHARHRHESMGVRRAYLSRKHCAFGIR